MKKYILYSEYGAVGDGVTNDFEAIRAAHEAANEKGLSIKADEGKTYYIGRSFGKSITVKTDCDFKNTTFIIDDSIIDPDMPDRVRPIFNVLTDYAHVKLDADSEIIKAINKKGGMKSTDKNCGYAPGFTAMLIPYNSENMVYIRYGGNASRGQEQHEIIIVDKDGNFDKDTPILLDYDKVTSMTVINVEDKPITLSGGIFITKANRAPRVYTSYSRNIEIARSNVTLKDMEHRIVDETDTGAPYGGFISMHFSNNLLVENTILQGHKTYTEPAHNNISMGTYDIGGSNFNGMYFKNCKQSNMFDENGKPRVATDIWGIMGTNYCKNITYDHSTLSRLDAHAGVYNASVINGSEVTYVTLIGGGTARIEDSKIYNSSLISLRGDYGSTWNGDVILKNVTHCSDAPVLKAVSGEWSYHYFGYKTYLPRNIVFDNIKTLYTPKEYQILGDFTNYAYIEYDYNDSSKRIEVGDVDFSSDKVFLGGELRDNPNPMAITENIYIRNQDSSLNLVPVKDSWVATQVNVTKT